MAYCELADVEALMQIVFTRTSHPTITEAESVIDDVAADLDGVAQASGYTLPITDTGAVAVLKRYNTLGAACACWHAGYQSDQAPARATYWCEQYDKFLTRLRKGEQQLPNLDPESDIDPVFATTQFPSRDHYWRSRTEDN